MSGALFGGTTSSGGRGKNLVEFRAGKMTLRGKMVHPDKRKGLLYVHQSDDNLMHFCWKERSKSNPEDDLIIFPDDVEFKPVPQCTTGRVFLLKFKSSNRNLFFWMQEPSSDKDESYCKKVNDFLNNPPAAGSSHRESGLSGLGGLPPELAANLGDSDLQTMLSGMSQQQLMQLMGGGLASGGLGGLLGAGLRPSGGGSSSSAAQESNPPSRVQSSPGPRQTTTASDTPSSARPVTASAVPPAATATATTASSSSAAIQLADLRNILSDMGVESTTGAGGAEAPKETIDLSAVLPTEVLIPMLANKDVQERLTPFLPQGESMPQGEEELKATVASPQFKQALRSFSQALASGQLGPVMGQFGFGEDAVKAASTGDLTAFVKAIQKEQGGAKTEEGETKMEEDTKPE